MGKIILDLCGGTGAWSKPYLEAGYDVQNITLPDYDVRTYKVPENVYGILAGPPCTIFSKARPMISRDRNFAGAMTIVEACLKIIWAARISGSLQFWALENPATGYSRQFLGHPCFVFQPVEFGDPWTKMTALWGYFHRPRKIHPVKKIRRIGSGYPQKVNQFKDSTRRSITPANFAKAFFKANP
ncbi:MAG TPA: hypothetical protein VF399_11960 [bacterium]